MWIGYCGKLEQHILNPRYYILTFSGFSDMKSLVGELDFSFHAVSTLDSAKSSMNVSRLSRASSFRDKND